MNLSTQRRDYGRGVSLTRPNLIGYFSLDLNREYHDDHSELKYIKMKNIIPREVAMDLNHMIDKRHKRIVDQGRLQGILSYLKNHREDLDAFSLEPITMDDVPFLCYRGALRAISKVPFENTDPLRLGVTLANGIIYMHTLETPEMRMKEDMSEREQTMCAWGYKFEQYMVSEDPYCDPDLSVPVDENSEFNCVYSAKLGEHSLVYGAEMDGFLIGDITDPQMFKEWSKENKDKQSRKEVLEHLRKLKQVELKTSRLIEEQKHFFSFKRFKCLTWWLQSYFAGNHVVVCGFRNDNGIVKKIRQYEMAELPKYAEGWDANVCLDFCHEFLSFVKKGLVAELKKQNNPITKETNIRSYPVIDLILHRNPRGPVKFDSIWPDEDAHVLEDWFVTMLPKKKTT